MLKILICTDLDRTLLPNGPQPESANARHYFSMLVSRPEVVLAYVTGRDKKLVEEAMQEYCLPAPDYVIGDVGTSIYRVGETHEWSKLVEWGRKIAGDWDGGNYLDVKTKLDDISALRPQEDHKQNHFKLSYYVKLNQNKQELSSEIQHRMASAGLKTRLIWSVDELENTGLLDILPLGASKLLAIEELMGLEDFDLTNTVFCGDSGNDIEVLASPIQAVLVRNSQPDIKALAQQLSEENGNSGQLYIASGIFHGLNGNYSAGLLEGVAHYFLPCVPWMGLKNNEPAS
ncbi:MAG: HAD-IIB family hydrolase [Pseudomonadales bacterium]